MKGTERYEEAERDLIAALDRVQGARFYEAPEAPTVGDLTAAMQELEAACVSMLCASRELVREAVAQGLPDEQVH